MHIATLSIIYLLTVSTQHHHHHKRIEHYARKLSEAILSDEESHYNGRVFREQPLRDPLVVPSGTKKSSNGTDFLITEETHGNPPQGYTSVFTNSKAYMISAQEYANISLVLVSKVKDYLPQLRVSKPSESSEIYEEAIPSYSLDGTVMSYKMKKGDTLVLEVGYDAKLNSHPYKNTIKTGAFNLIVSLDGKSITSYLDRNKISTAGAFVGNVVLENSKPLLLSANWRKDLDHGSLNMKLTPFYDTAESSISIFYHKGSNYNTGSVYRSTIVKEICDPEADPDKITPGTEPSGGRYVLKVKSPKVCNYIKLLGDFN